MLRHFVPQKTRARGILVASRLLEKESVFESFIALIMTFL